MACLGSRSRGRGELEPCYQGCSAWTNWIQDCSGWAGTHTRAGTAALATIDQHPGTRWSRLCARCAPQTCRPTKRLKSAGQHESGSCNGWWSDAHLVTGFLHDLKEGSKCWLSCNVFSERFRAFHVSWGCEKPLLTKAAMCLMKGWEKNPTEPKRSLAATVCSCNCQQASTAWKSVLRRFSCT